MSHVWYLVFMFASSTGPVPMISGPHQEDVCLEMAQSNTKKFGMRAHCYHRETRERKYPDMRKEYL